MKPVYLFAAVLGIVSAIAFGLVVHVTVQHERACQGASAKSMETMFVPCLATAEAVGNMPSSREVDSPAVSTPEQRNAKAWVRTGRSG